ncbi:MAG: hypothetical protein ABSG53_19300 [Thermoguttaceae bacterium]
MDTRLRTVTSLPLAELWADAGTLMAQRGRYVTCEDLQRLLRKGPLHFVVADCGKPLRWIEHSACYDFWKQEVKPHFAAPDAISPEDYPDGRCYLASEWTIDGSKSAIVLEMFH